MYDFLIAASGFVVVMMAVGLFLVLRGPGNTERMMAAQLVGTGGIAALLMAGTATGATAAADLALTLALLATFASIAFVKKGTPGSPDAPEGPGE
jgi:multicomponent Na+:H+ antiporter subunit F